MRFLVPKAFLGLVMQLMCCRLQNCHRGTFSVIFFIRRGLTETVPSVGSRRCNLWEKEEMDAVVASHVHRLLSPCVV